MPTSLLQKYADSRAKAAEELRLKTRADLKRLLFQLLPGTPIVVFGSLTKPGYFSAYSDVDIGLEVEPKEMSVYQLTSLLAEGLGRPVDVVLLQECRFRDSILKGGERWTQSD